MQRLVVYGSGGHAKVIIDIVHRCGKHEIVGLVDDDPDKSGKVLLGEQVIGTLADLRRYHDGGTGLVLGIGDSGARHRVWERLGPLNVDYQTVVHPSAILGEGVVIGQGTVVMAGAVINCCTHIGEHVVINTRSSIDHDCRIGDFAHIAPGASLCGGVRVGRLSLVGVGANVLPGVTIGQEAVVGAGATVTRDVPDGVCVVGVPAKPRERGRAGGQ